MELKKDMGWRGEKRVLKTCWVFLPSKRKEDLFNEMLRTKDLKEFERKIWILERKIVILKRRTMNTFELNCNTTYRSKRKILTYITQNVAIKRLYMTTQKCEYLRSRNYINVCRLTFSHFHLPLPLFFSRNSRCNHQKKKTKMKRGKLRICFLSFSNSHEPK